MIKWYLIYDDNCSLCNSSVEQIKKLDRVNLITLVPLSDPRNPKNLALPPTSELEKQIHLINSEGIVYRGADAIGRLSSLFPESRALGWVISLPGIRQLARICYGVVARNRMKLPGYNS